MSKTKTEYLKELGTSLIGGYQPAAVDKLLTELLNHQKHIEAELKWLSDLAEKRRSKLNFDYSSAHLWYQYKKNRDYLQVLHKALSHHFLYYISSFNPKRRIPLDPEDHSVDQCRWR